MVPTINQDEKRSPYVHPQNRNTRSLSISSRKSSSWTIDDFEIGNLLGRGRFGYVYCGREKQTRFVVALKVIDRSKLSTDYNILYRYYSKFNWKTPRWNNRWNVKSKFSQISSTVRSVFLFACTLPLILGTRTFSVSTDFFTMSNESTCYWNMHLAENCTDVCNRRKP